MTLDTYRASTGRIFYPLARILNRRGVSANQLSALSLLFALIAGLAFFAQLLPLAVITVALNAFFDALDGCVARSANCQSPKGDLIDHVIDRYADILIFGGIVLGGYVPWQIGLIAIIGILMTSYLGTQAQAIGAGRDYRGLLGRADRLLLVFIVGILNAIYAAPIIWFPLLGWLMLALAIASNFTALQRFYLVYKEL